MARIVAVADAFSAMTTTRPYRKALGTEEALRRLEAAAGEQLEAHLVAEFVTGLRTDPDGAAAWGRHHAGADLGALSPGGLRSWSGRRGRTAVGADGR